MTAMDSHVRLEITIPGDPGHVQHRTAEVVGALGLLGFRLMLKLEGPTYLLQDHEDPIDSATVDAEPTPWPPGWKEAGYIDETGPTPVVVGDPRLGAVRADMPDDAGRPDRFTTGVPVGFPPIDPAVPPVPSTKDDPGTGPVMLAGVCGMAVCGHDAAVHNPFHTPAKAGQMAARPAGSACGVEVSPGVICNCPGFTPVTGNLLSGPKPMPY